MGDFYCEEYDKLTKFFVEAKADRYISSTVINKGVRGLIINVECTLTQTGKDYRIDYSDELHTFLLVESVESHVELENDPSKALKLLIEADKQAYDQGISIGEILRADNRKTHGRV